MLALPQRILAMIKIQPNDALAGYKRTHSIPCCLVQRKLDRVERASKTRGNNAVGAYKY